MMQDDIIHMAMESLDDLLERERHALIKGDLQKLDSLVETKEQLLDELKASGAVKRDQIEAVEEKLKRNQRLLDHALEGIRSVSNRMAALRRIRSSLDTYDKSGRRTTVEVHSVSTVEKRA